MEPWVFLPEREPVPERPPQTAGEVIRWWECRRLKYNLFALLLVVLLRGAGVLHHLLHVKQNGEFPEWGLGFLFTMFYAVLCLTLVNTGYTLGWVAELAARKLLGDRVGRFGPVVLRLLYVAPALLLSAIMGSAVSHMMFHHLYRH